MTDHLHFQRTPSQAATDAAVDASEMGAPGAWLRLARRAVMFAARRSPAGFTTEEVWSVLEPEVGGVPDEPRALGAVMRSLKAEGRIHPTGEYQPAAQVKSHRRPLTVWALTQHKHNTTQPDPLVAAYRLSLANLLEALEPRPPT